MPIQSRKEAFYFYNNLVCLVKAMENQYTTIDLHNEECVTGKIRSVDGYMNVDLVDAVFYNARGDEIPFKSFFVRARCIRYVHIPANMPIFDTIKKSVSHGKPVAKKATNKEKRTLRKHKQTVAGLRKRTEFKKRD